MRRIEDGDEVPDRRLKTITGGGCRAEYKVPERKLITFTEGGCMVEQKVTVRKLRTIHCGV